MSTLRTNAGHTLRSTTRALLILLLLGIPEVVPSQTKSHNPRIRLAQSYEQAGKLEEATRIYEELHAEDPANIVFFDGLRRMYLQQKRYDEAILLIQQRLASNQSDVSLRSQLGSVLYKAGREAEAHATWEQALAVDDKNPAHYRTVAAVLMENRLLEKTAELYRRARTACGDPNLFTMELAQLLGISMDYRGATAEFIRWIRKNPNQLSFVESKMTTITSNEVGRRAAIAEVEETLKNEEDLRLYELAAWLRVEGKEFEEAFDAYKKIDRISNAHGTAVFTFAERAYKERAFEVAAKAYLEAINLPIQSTTLPRAKYGYALCLKEISVMADTSGTRGPENGLPATESVPRYSGVIAQFQQLIEEYPRTEFSARAHLEIGALQFERFFDLDGALQSFAAVEAELSERNNLSFLVKLKQGEVYTAKGDTASAASRFREVIDAGNATPDQQDEASYRLAELEFFRGQFKDAEQRLTNLTLDLHANYANNALGLLTLLQENSTSAGAGLREFARAEYLSRQKRNNEAIPLFLAVIDQNPQSLLVDDALMRVAHLQAEARLYSEAIATYERLLTQFTESSIALDKAQFHIGEIYQYRIKDNAKAISAYEALLANFSQSLHVTDARKRIRELRGETL